jgi:hypothetical protein
MFTLYKGKEGTLWKDMVLVSKGELKEVLRKYIRRDGDYILWWLIDNSKIPEAYIDEPIFKLFLSSFSKDWGDGIEYKSDFVAGFYDDVSKSRSWGLLK